MVGQLGAQNHLQAAFTSTQRDGWNSDGASGPQTPGDPASKPYQHGEGSKLEDTRQHQMQPGHLLDQSSQGNVVEKLKSNNYYVGLYAIVLEGNFNQCLPI